MTSPKVMSEASWSLSDMKTEKSGRRRRLRKTKGSPLYLEAATIDPRALLAGVSIRALR